MSAHHQKALLELYQKKQAFSLLDQPIYVWKFSEEKN